MATFNLTNQNKDTCLSCQWCCHHLFVPLAYNDDEFYMTRGHDCIHRQHSDEVLIGVTCQHSTKDGCAIYEERPLACHLFPYEDHPVIREHCALMRERFPHDSC